MLFSISSSLFTLFAMMNSSPPAEQQQEELNQANSRFFQPFGVGGGRGRVATAGKDVPPGSQYQKQNKKQQQKVQPNEESKSSSSSSSSSPPKYINTNIWPRSSRGRKLKKSATRSFIHGVEIKRLEDPHPLSGELGLFAAQPFNTFDILGEYCGQVYDGEGGSEYATYLEDRREKYPLGVDATLEGNESRFINHFAGIAEEPNVIMKIAYVEEIPRVMIVCQKDIVSGEEFLFKYSDEFTSLYCS